MNSNKQLTHSVSHNIEALLDIMSRLRHPENGCQWNREQTFNTLIPYTIEESYEVADAIERNNMDDLRVELGDLLYQIIFYTQIAKELGKFQFVDVLNSLVEKLISRHPHVFSKTVQNSFETHAKKWEKQKIIESSLQNSNEKFNKSLMDKIPSSLPAMLKAIKIQKRAAVIDFDWHDIAGVFKKVEEELKEVNDAYCSQAENNKLSEELGDLLFSCVNLARHTNIDPEIALRNANIKFERRFRHMEIKIQKDGKTGKTLSSQQLNMYWEKVKREET